MRNCIVSSTSFWLAWKVAPITDIYHGLILDYTAAMHTDNPEFGTFTKQKRLAY